MRIQLQHLLMALALAGMLASGCRTKEFQTDGSEPAIRAALDQQVRAWNAGDLAGFMEIYDRSDQTRFASGGEISRGWQPLFEIGRAHV